MRLHGALADRELACDRFVRLAVGHQAKRGHLSRRELHARHAFGQLRRRRRRQIRLAGEHVVDAVDQVVGGDVLQDVRLRAGLQRARDVVVGIVGGEHDDARVRIALADLPHGFDAFHHGHAQVEQRDVRPMPLERLHGLASVLGFGDDVQIGLEVDDVGDAGSEQPVIVCHEDRRFRHRRIDRIRRQHALASAMTPVPRRLRCRFAAR